MKKLAVFAVAVVLAASAFGAAGWIGNSYIYANGDWYAASGSEGDWTAGSWSDLGTISSLLLGGQIQIWDENGSDWASGAGDWMHYTIDGDDTAWVDMNMAYSTYGGDYGNNMLFQTGGTEFATTAVDISALDDGEHTISIYFGGVDGQYDSNGGANYTATFTKTSSTPAVPEPATMSLLGLGALAMVLRRKLRK